MAKITTKTAAALRVPEGATRAELVDDEVPGLALRVTASGRRTWTLRYGPRGAQRRYVVGHFPALGVAGARKRARALVVKVDDGADPQSKRKAARVASTFGELADDWLAEAKTRKRPRSYAEDVRKLTVEILPHWSSRKVAEITRADARALLLRVRRERGGVCSNRTRALLHAIFADAVEGEAIAMNPVSGIKRLTVERPRERVLSAEEVARLWAALDACHPVVATAWRLIVLTAARPGEVMGMRWRDLTDDADGRWWSLAAAATKTNTGRRVPLSPLAVELVERLRALNGKTAYVMSFRAGEPLKWLSASTRRLREATGIEDFTPHDLRRTAATWLGREGVRPDVIERLLGHSMSKIMKTYNVASYDRETREAVTLLGELVAKAAALPTPEVGKVATIAGRRKVKV